MSARILNLNEREYFADQGSEVPRLSQSIARVLVRESCAHAWQQHPRLGKTEDDHTESKDKGKVIGKLVLGKGADIEVIVADSFRSNAAKAARDMARLQGRVPVIEEKFEGMQRAAEVIKSKLADRGYVFDGESEVAIEWEEKGEGGPVLCRGRLDHLKRAKSVIWDFKTITSAHPETCSKHIYDFGYDIQWAAYCSALRKLEGEPDLFIDYVLLFAETEPPYAITEVDFNRCGAFRDIGESAWARAVAIWERCLAVNEWPEFVKGPIGVEPMAWVMNKEIGSGNW